MISRVERQQQHTILVIDAIRCDRCGQDAAVLQGIGQDSQPAARFERSKKNTAENPISETAWINQWLVAEVADLCPDCAKDVADFIRDSARRRHPGIRAPQPVDETIRRGIAQ